MLLEIIYLYLTYIFQSFKGTDYSSTIAKAQDLLSFCKIKFLEKG